MMVPEGIGDNQTLQELASSLERTETQGMQDHIPWGDTESGGQSLFDSLVVNHQLSPGGDSGKCNNQEHVICINKPLKVIPNLYR